MASTSSTTVLVETANMKATIHYSASDFLDAAEAALCSRERNANTILPHARKTRKIEHSRASASDTSSRRAVVESGSLDHVADSVSANDQFWITFWSKDESSSTSTSSDILDLAISSTRSEIDNLPLFFWSRFSASSLTDSFLRPRLSFLAQIIHTIVPTTRVFSVFSSSIITSTFAECWHQETGIRQVGHAYYEAALTFVNRDTLTSEDPARCSRKRNRHPFQLRRATTLDIPTVAEQCFEFAEGSDFEISMEGATLEASTYIKRNQVYVCEVELPCGTREIASVVAVTRNTDRYAMITKVHTATKHRSMGYAETLVREVCHRLLYDEEVRFGRQAGDLAPYNDVALYVAHDNKPAAIVYDRVGFAGLLGKDRPEGVEDVLELGFEGATKGYW